MTMRTKTVAPAKGPTGAQMIANRNGTVTKPNPQYAGVTSKINSGPTIDKFYQKHSAGQLNAHGSHQIGKGFQRIRLNTLAKWMEAAMIVMSQPDYVETGESIYDLERGIERAEPAYSECTTTGDSMSMAGTEASVCGEERGVPAMFICGPDIMEEEEVRRFTSDPFMTSQNANFESAYVPTSTTINRTQQANAFVDQNQQSAAAAAFASKKQQQGGRIFDSAPEPSNELRRVQQFTTRSRHEKIMSRIQFIPNLKLEIFKSVQDLKRLRYLPLLAPTKQFAIVDMRPERVEFDRCHLWGSVHVPVAMLRRSTGNRLPEALYYFSKFEESVMVVCGLTGSQLEEAGRMLQELGILGRNIVLLMQTFEEIQATNANLFVRD